MTLGATHHLQPTLACGRGNLRARRACCTSAVLSGLTQDPYPSGRSMSQTRAEPAQQACHRPACVCTCACACDLRATTSCVCRGGGGVGEWGGGRSAAALAGTEGARRLITLRSPSLHPLSSRHRPCGSLEVGGCEIEATYRLNVCRLVPNHDEAPRV